MLSRISHQELTDLMRGYGHEPFFVEGDDPVQVHQALAGTLNTVLARIQQIQAEAQNLDPALSLSHPQQRPRWPMIVLRTPKGWTGPKTVDGQPVEGSWRAHQVPISEFKTAGQLPYLRS